MTEESPLIVYPELNNAMPYLPFYQQRAVLAPTTQEFITHPQPTTLQPGDYVSFFIRGTFHPHLRTGVVVSITSTSLKAVTITPGMLKEAYKKYEKYRDLDPETYTTQIANREVRRWRQHQKHIQECYTCPTHYYYTDTLTQHPDVDVLEKNTYAECFQQAETEITKHRKPLHEHIAFLTRNLPFSDVGAASQQSLA